MSAGIALIVLGAATAGADPNLNTVPPHRHYITMSGGQQVEVGPRVCDDPSLQEAFNQFHNNLHVSAGFGRAARGSTTAPARRSSRVPASRTSIDRGPS